MGPATNGTKISVSVEGFRGDRANRDDSPTFGGAACLELTLSSRHSGQHALLELAKELGLDRALYSRKEAWMQDCLAMLVERVVYPGSKLALPNQRKNTALSELSGCYYADADDAARLERLDRIDKRGQRAGRLCLDKETTFISFPQWARRILARNVAWDFLLPMDQLEPTRKSETTRLYSLKRLNAIYEFDFKIAGSAGVRHFVGLVCRLAEDH